MGGRKRETDSFQGYPRDRIRGNWNKVKHIKFHLNRRKHLVFFYSEVGQTLEEVTQTDCGVSIYEDPQKLMDIVLDSLLLPTLLESGGWTRLSQEIPSSLSDSEIIFELSVDFVPNILSDREVNGSF